MLEYWYLTPYCLVGATIAMSSGVGGPVFFTPLFILVLQLPPATAVATALFTQVFGFLSGTLAYARLGQIDRVLARRLIPLAAGAALLGSVLASRVPGALLSAMFGAVSILVGWRVFATSGGSGVDRRTDHYPREMLAEGLTTTAVGSTLLGLISVGLAELQSYHLLVRARLAPARAVATNVAVVVVAVAAASGGHLYSLISHTSDGTMDQALRMLPFTVPGVLVGGQLGPRLQMYLRPVFVQRGVGGLLVAIGLMMTLMGIADLSS